jgi:hypothetical protein
MKIYIPRDIYQQIMHWINKTDKEISGYGKIQWADDKSYCWVSSVYILDKGGSSVTTEISTKAYAKIVERTYKLDGDLNFWWHSHVNMAVFWSGTDKSTIQEIGAHGYCVATVFNKKNEMRSAICYKSSSLVGESVEFKDEVPTEIYDPEPSAEQLAVWDSEFNEAESSEQVRSASQSYSPNKRWNHHVQEWEEVGTSSMYGKAWYDSDQGPQSFSQWKAQKEATQVGDVLDEVAKIKSSIAQMKAGLTVTSPHYRKIDNDFDGYTARGITTAVAWDAALIGVIPEAVQYVHKMGLPEEIKDMEQLLEKLEVDYMYGEGR